MFFKEECAISSCVENVARLRGMVAVSGTDVCSISHNISRAYFAGPPATHHLVGACLLSPLAGG